MSIYASTCLRELWKALTLMVLGLKEDGSIFKRDNSSSENVIARGTRSCPIILATISGVAGDLVEIEIGVVSGVAFASTLSGPDWPQQHQARLDESEDETESEEEESDEEGRDEIDEESEKEEEQEEEEEETQDTDKGSPPATHGRDSDQATLEARLAQIEEGQDKGAPPPSFDSDN
ncbi:uncharacterized protein LOC131226820 [Magnolia sinica]|uniref:uncharacterized protein LOC131226820 n=1 Tax=Magnolia sinica TaxID=86752 RepID=UPI0026587A0D|nr:uncharacterized protein LOC131226820 [Magnolia sinica]